MVFQIILLTLWLVVVRGREEKGKERGKEKRKEIVGKVSFLRCVWIPERKERISFVSFVWFIKENEMKFVYFFLYTLIFTFICLE